MQHLRWEKSGRVFSHADEGKPNQFTWKSSIGQQNVDLGNGQFAPYVWNPGSKIIKFGDCELRFTTSGLEFWQGAEKLNTLSFHPEYKQGPNWKRRTLVPGSLSTIEIDPGNSKVELKISYKIITQDSETEIFVRVGYNHKVHFGTRFKALVAGVEQRIALEFAELFSPIEERDRQGNLLPTARLKTAKSWWAWDRKEQINHEIEQTTVTKINLGRKVYAANEEKIISPDTWGLDVGIVANADDGDDQDGVWNISGYSSNNCYLGYGTTPWDAGSLRWANITIAQGSVINSCIIDVYQDDGTGTITSLILYAWSHDNAPVCDASNLPRNVTKTTANANVTAVWDDSVGWKNLSNTSVLKEIVDRVLWVSGNAVNFIVQSSNADWAGWRTFQDYNNAGTNEAELTITYTPPAGGLTIPIAMDNYRFRRI